MSAEDRTDEQLLEAAAKGDPAAIDRLLERHRNRIRKMLAVWMDPRLQSRIDASDLVQEAMIEASRRLSESADTLQAPFYPWLRRVAWNRMRDAVRRHVEAERRTLQRERPLHGDLPDPSAAELVEQLIASGTSPSGRLRRKELQERVRAALDELPAQDREILILRYLEQVQPAEIAAILGIPERTVRARHRRALDRMLSLLEHDTGG